jgi:phosphatidylserine decarboxylase
MSQAHPRWYHRLYVGLQHLLPQHLLSALIYRATRVRWRPFKSLQIGAFIRLFGVDMGQARDPDPAAYAHFNAFFTRALRADARPAAEEADAVLCPADGTLSQLGAIDDGLIFQAKGLAYSLDRLLAGESGWTERFSGGDFATVYLSPRDYHRVHMPVGARLRAMRHVPGRLFSVNAVTTSLVPRLFTRNERVVCLFDGEAGPMAVVLVGAIFVGSMETVWSGQVTPRTARLPERKTCSARSFVELGKGEEMGRFNMGSTVILLFPPRAVEWDPDLTPGQPVRVGQRLGRIRSASTP